MRTKNILPITEARKNIFALAENVQSQKSYYTLTEHGRPKAVLVSAEKFEELLEKKSFRISDASSEIYGERVPQIFSKGLIIRDESRVVYLSDKDRENKNRQADLVKAQLYVQLIEKYGYPVEMVQFGRYVKIGEHDSKRYIEADVIVNDARGNVRMIFEVSPFSDFEKNTDRVAADLFDLGRALSLAKKPERLVHYSRAMRNGKAEEKIISIDYSRFDTFLSWKRAGRPGEKTIQKAGE
jgi:prevent-host-death family protein